MTLCTCGRQGRPHRDHSGPFGLGQHATVHRTPVEWVEIASGRWRGRQGSLVAKANTRPGGNGGTVFIVALNEGRTVRVRSIRTGRTEGDDVTYRDPAMADPTYAAWIAAAQQQDKRRPLDPAWQHEFREAALRRIAAKEETT